MAKAATKTKAKESSKVVALRGSANVPAHIDELADKYSGLGTSTDAHDNIIPMGRILQKMSPEVDKKNPNYVQGAEPGDIYFKNLPLLIKGSEGFLFQPCDYKWGYVEWITRGKGGGGGSGFVAFYPPHQKPKDTKMVPDPMNPERQIEVRKDNGNAIIETRYHSGYMIDPDGEHPPIGCTLPFSGSGHSVSKTWMGMMNRKITPKGKKAASFMAAYRLVSISKTKNNNTWDLFEVQDAGPEENGLPTTLWLDAEQVELGAQLHFALASGEKKIDESDTDNADDKM